MANETALLELVNVIGEANDKGLWDQADWATETACGTTYCAAGWKAVIDGQKFDYVLDNQVYSCMLTNGQYVETYAREALELTVAESEYLFHYYNNDYDKFVSRVKDVINGEMGWTKL